LVVIKQFVLDVFRAQPPLPLFVRLARFGAIGVTGTLTDLVVFNTLALATVPFAVGRVISILSATLVTWSLNRQITFGSSGGRTHYELIRYILVTGLVQGINYFVFVSLKFAHPTWPSSYLIVGMAPVSALLSFLAQSKFTFRTTAVTG
jgi:putative flippase GtrA